MLPMAALNQAQSFRTVEGGNEGVQVFAVSLLGWLLCWLGIGIVILNLQVKGLSKLLACACFLGVVVFLPCTDTS